MDSYDPTYNPDTYDPNNPNAAAPPAGAPNPDDPDMGYIHNNDQSLPPESYDPNAPDVPGVDAGVYEDPEYDDNAYGHGDHYGDEHYGDEYPPPDGDIPHNIGVGYDQEPDENGNYNDGFDDDDDVYLDNHRNDASYEIESSDPKDGFADVFWRNCLLTCTCLFLVSGLIVLAIRINQISDEDAKKHYGSSPYHHSSVYLAPPPADLAEKCTQKNVLSEKGFFECEELCEPSDCCSYPTTLALSCLAGHDDECLEYHEHCHVLQLDEEELAEDPPKPPQNIPEAPKDIENKCNIESLRTVPGFEACVNDCMQGECCWKKDGSVRPCTSLAVCDGYASCLTMDVTDHVHMDISQEISEKCADEKLSTEVGRNQCIFACSHAACCFDPTASCPHEDSSFCDQYQPCDKIFDESGQVIQGGSAESTIPIAPQFLDTACSVTSLNTLPGYEMCLGACTEAECCWKGKAECLGQKGCDGYHHCVSLLDHGKTDAPETTESSLPEAPEYLAAACSTGSLDTSAGFQMCQDACMEAECCWRVASCKEQPECSGYANSCANLAARLEAGQTSGGSSQIGSSFLPDAPHDLDDECDPSNILDQDGYDKCSQACSKAECCWKAGASDSCVEEAQCRPWAPCVVLNGAQSPEAAATQDYSMEQVFDACLNHDNNVGGGSSHKTLCQIVCESGSCCFDDDKGCPNTLDCKVFEPCGVLHNEKQSQVEDACNGDDLAECVGVCATATCCFTNDISKICDMTNPNIICKQFKACEILYSAEIASP